MSRVVDRTAALVVAVGKSSVSRELADRLGAVHLAADRVRDDLLHEPAGEPVHEAHWWRTFEHGFDGEIYRELLGRADERLSAGESVVLDGCFARAHQRLEARSLAIARDADGPGTGWHALHDDLAERWEPVSELASNEHVVVNGEGAMDAVLAPIDARLLAVKVGPAVAPERLSLIHI